ncbi:hypothetical protein BDA99DRAFT_522386 [Phascolomyces articulosus]|uniref:Uncharacterized protein n=1 Tax=Phascolomyces articulosus TaxID=60185 RepID=A0AAD5K2H8_9FUNG|nr:hypothetical protein BDA99DRAFT_522386 [Phascolomyces articulosus]
MKIDVPADDNDEDAAITTTVSSITTINNTITGASSSSDDKQHENDELLSLKDTFTSLSNNSKDLRDTLVKLWTIQNKQEDSVRRIKRKLDSMEKNNSSDNHHANDMPTPPPTISAVSPNLFTQQQEIEQKMIRQLSGVSITDSASFIQELQEQHELEQFFKQQQSLYPTSFIQFPRNQDGSRRATRYDDVVKAIYSLFNSTEEREKILSFLTASVETAMGKIKRRATHDQLAQSWIYQSEFTRNYVSQWFVKVATDHSPTIPVGLCEKNWLSRYLLQKNWYDHAEVERSRREREGIVSPRKRKHQQQLCVDYIKQPIWISDDDYDDKYSVLSSSSSPGYEP